MCLNNNILQNTTDRKKQINKCDGSQQNIYINDVKEQWNNHQRHRLIEECFAKIMKTNRANINFRPEIGNVRLRSGAELLIHFRDPSAAAFGPRSVAESFISFSRSECGPPSVHVRLPNLSKTLENRWGP